MAQRRLVIKIRRRGKSPLLLEMPAGTSSQDLERIRRERKLEDFKQRAAKRFV